MADATIITELALLDNQTAGVKKAETQIKALGTTTTKAMDDVKKATAGLDQSAKQLQSSIAGTTGAGRTLNQAFTQLTNTSEGLKNSLGGVSVVGVALATGLGNLIGQAVGNMIRGILESITAFGQMHNEMARTPGLATNSANALALVRNVATTSEQSFRDLAQQYRAVSEEAARLNISQEFVTDSFKRWHEAQKAFQLPTVIGSLQRFGTAFGGVVTGIDNSLGISRLFIGALDGISYALNLLGMRMPQAETEFTALAKEIARARSELDFLNRTGIDGIQSINGEIQTREQLGQTLRKLYVEYGNLQRARDPSFDLRRMDTIRSFIAELDQTISTLGKSPVAASISNQFFQITEQLSRFGEISLDELRTLREKISTATLVPQLEPYLASLRTVEENELTSYTRRLELARQFFDSRLVNETEFNNLIAQESFRHSIAMQQIAQNTAAMQMQATSGALQEASNLFGVFAAKSKAAAVAQIILNKGLAIAQAVQNTAVAQTRALAELGPIAGPPVAASIAAWGKVQIALIAATGLGQIAGLGGSSAPRAGGGSGSGTDVSTSTDTAPPSRAIHITLEKAALYSAEQVQELMDVINEEVRNGATLISTENVRF
jgi:hypothetical protein